MKKGVRIALIAAILLIIAGSVYFSYSKTSGDKCTETTCGITSEIANPASVYCEKQNGTSKIITASDGSQSGLCVLQNGTECDEWKFFRGEC